jgi:hypothetical protein
MALQGPIPVEFGHRMRGKVTGEQYAQIDNPGPFASRWPPRQTDMDHRPGLSPSSVAIMR